MYTAFVLQLVRVRNFLNPHNTCNMRTFIGTNFQRARQLTTAVALAAANASRNLAPFPVDTAAAYAAATALPCVLQVPLATADAKAFATDLASSHPHVTAAATALASVKAMETSPAKVMVVFAPALPIPEGVDLGGAATGAFTEEFAGVSLVTTGCAGGVAVTGRQLTTALACADARASTKA
jgi:hypothetical protein